MDYLVRDSDHLQMRDPDGEHALSAGDLVCFLEGPDGGRDEMAVTLTGDSPQSNLRCVLGTVPIRSDCGSLGTVPRLANWPKATMKFGATVDSLLEWPAWPDLFCPALAFITSPRGELHGARSLSMTRIGCLSSSRCEE